MCYVSQPSDSFEAEVLISSGRYIYGGHFFMNIPIYDPNYNGQPKTFMFVIIKRIDPIAMRPMNKLQFNKFQVLLTGGVPIVNYNENSETDSEMINKYELIKNISLKKKDTI
jgi:hypothetical protein